MKVIQI